MFSESWPVTFLLDKISIFFAILSDKYSANLSNDSTIIDGLLSSGVVVVVVSIGIAVASIGSLFVIVCFSSDTGSAIGSAIGSVTDSFSFSSGSAVAIVCFSSGSVTESFSSGGADAVVCSSFAVSSSS